MLQLSGFFIAEHVDELVKLEDYVPISFTEYAKGHERVEFLRSKNLLSTMHEMDELVRQKCNHYEDSVKAYDSVLIEWLSCHPEFEGIIAAESIVDYANMKNSNSFISFLDLLYDVELPSEKEEIDFSKFDYDHDRINIKDDSRIKYPNFKQMSHFLDDYPNTLLADYLAYLV